MTDRGEENHATAASAPDEPQRRGSKGGAAASDIARAIGESTPDRLRYGLATLRSEKRVTLSGSRSTARYHAV